MHTYAAEQIDNSLLSHACNYGVLSPIHVDSACCLSVQCIDENLLSVLESAKFSVQYC